MDDADDDDGNREEDELCMSGRSRYRKAFAGRRSLVINRACETTISMIVNNAYRKQITDLTH